MEDNVEGSLLGILVKKKVQVNVNLNLSKFISLSRKG